MPVMTLDSSRQGMHEPHRRSTQTDTLKARDTDWNGCGRSVYRTWTANNGYAVQPGLSSSESKGAFRGSLL